MRALAVARGSAGRQLPDVPTLVESGFPDFTVDAWTGVAAPAGTPAEIVQPSSTARSTKASQSAEAKAGLARFSAIAQNRHAAGLRRVVASEAAEMGRDRQIGGRQDRLSEANPCLMTGSLDLLIPDT